MKFEDIEMASCILFLFFVCSHKPMLMFLDEVTVYTKISDPIYMLGLFYGMI